MKGTLNKAFSTPQVVGVELFSAGWCNLACKYCYIPKTEFLKGIHKSIIERIKDGSFIEDIKEIYGTDVEVMAHWGTEPTLTVKHFKDFYDRAAVAFPKLRKVKISSNFMTNPDNLVTWVTEIIPQNKTMDVDIQVSLDGPPFISDKNRIGGSTLQIVENCLKVTEELNRIGTHHNVSMHLKPTAGDDDIIALCDMSKTIEYYEFFDDFMTRWYEANSKNLVNIMSGVDPTLVLPGTYTQVDGKNFYQLLLNQLELQKRKWRSIAKPESNYYWRYREKFPFYKEFATRHKMFPCSAGDSCFALGDIPGTSHICHQSFYMDHSTYYDEAEAYGLDPQTMEGIRAGRVEGVKKYFITHKDDELKTSRMLYLTRAFNDFIEMKRSTYIAQTLELASIGQINPIYKNIKMAEQLSYLLATLSCPMDNTTIAGSQLVGCISSIKVFANGVFENIFERVIKEYK